ncbi:MAG: DNA helicase RecQ [Pseudomonadota bacterium]|nr:DNA helicase RecQ [Pseudomonadota bacterium]
MAPSASYISANSDTDLRSVLHDAFGFSDLRVGQREAIEAVLAGRNVLAVMPTGAGKSLCYQLPALVRGGLTVVVSPLVALMRDQVAVLRMNGIAAATINSDISREENIRTWYTVRDGEVRLLYLSPERLMTQRMQVALGKLEVNLFAIDEAHCISQWGPAFRPEYAMLAELRTGFPGTPIIGLTATADRATRDDIEDKIFGGDVVRVVTGFDRPNLSLGVTLKNNWKRQIIGFVNERRKQAGIVYCLSRRKTEEVAALLREDGHTALAFHAGMDSVEKSAIQNRFMTDPGVVMVATIAFGMGIDKPDIRFVAHTDLPASPEAYYQEIGRAGRDGAPAETMLFYGLDDIRTRRVFIEEAETTDVQKRREHKRLDALIAYCEAPDCRRQMLLRYFGEAKDDACGNCDVCIHPVETVDGTEEAKMVLLAVRGTGNRFGGAHIVAVLRGRANDKAAQLGHDRLDIYGAGAGRDQKEWRGILRQMVASNLLEIDVAGYGGLKITSSGLALLEDDGEFRYRTDRIQKASSRRRRKSPELEKLDVNGNALLGVLKAKRLRLAEARGVPSYVIFSDRSLIDMAVNRPSTRDEFAQIFGVGETKLREFGDIFIDVIAAN